MADKPDFSQHDGTNDYEFFGEPMLQLYFGMDGKAMANIDEFATEKEVYEKIQEMLDNANYKSYYMRRWLSNEEQNIYTIDYGSHNFFFYIKYPKGRTPK
jgi:hypothetical protein